MPPARQGFRAVHYDHNIINAQLDNTRLRRYSCRTPCRGSSAISWWRDYDIHQQKAGGIPPRRRALTMTMLVTVDTEKQDERDKRNEEICLYILLIFIPHPLLLTPLFLLLVWHNLDRTMSTTANTDEQDKRDEWKEKVSICILDIYFLSSIFSFLILFFFCSIDTIWT